MINQNLKRETQVAQKVFNDPNHKILWSFKYIIEYRYSNVLFFLKKKKKKKSYIKIIMKLKIKTLL